MKRGGEGRVLYNVHIVVDRREMKERYVSLGDERQKALWNDESRHFRGMGVGGGDGMCKNMFVCMLARLCTCLLISSERRKIRINKCELIQNGLKKLILKHLKHTI